MGIDYNSSQIYSAIQGQKFYYLNADCSLSANIPLKNLLKQMAGRPGNIVLPDKQLTFTDPVVLGLGQGLVGLGKGTKLNFTKLSDGATAITFDRNSMFQNISLVGKSTCIGMANKDSVGVFQFDNVELVGFKVGLNLDNTWVGIFNNLICSNNDIGVKWINYVNAFQFLGGHFGGNRRAFSCESTYAPQMKNTISTTIEGNSEAGIVLNGWCVSTTVRDCYFELNGDNQLGGNGGDVIVGIESQGTTIDGCFGVRSTPMFKVSGKNTRISNCVGWSKNFLLITPEAKNTVVDYNAYYTSADYDICVGITNQSDTTVFLPHTESLSAISAASASPKSIIKNENNFASPEGNQLKKGDVVKSDQTESILPAMPVNKKICDSPILIQHNGTKGCWVEIINTTTGSLTYYTIDETTPSSTNGTLFTKGFYLTKSCVVKAICTKLDFIDSIVTSFNFVARIEKPIVDCKRNGNLVHVDMKCPTENVKIYYTFDSTLPTPTNGFLYNESFSFEYQLCILKARAYRDDMLMSLVTDVLVWEVQ